ncbi:hypothetical protein [Saccharothrix obliqua]|uniref:hypothetical protein n=1 Tax=Saccharothrix obliqua TaxID=2861747 RepID=UPI001C5EBE05|nr:hypothetical protein [Saccharothrix obliqua]MBW4722069.1 hypothetical protein [Saccharothrix obliqua]
MTRYLGSTRNLAGCVGGLLGVGLHLLGLVGAWWPLVVVALYTAGALLAPPEKARPVSVDAATEADRVRAELDELVAGSSALPGAAADGVRRVADLLRDVLARPDRLAADPDLRHELVRLARTDLPLSVRTYLDLPRWLATRETGDGPGAEEELVTQLGLLERQAHRLAERCYADDVHRQADHTRYLRGHDD